MAKSTTNNKKTVSKKQNKSFFGKKFDLKSRKVQFFVSILIIAILGGGYFTFRSFAAEWTYYLPFAHMSYQVNNQKKFNWPGRTLPCRGTPATDQSKASMQVISITCDNSNSLHESIMYIAGYDAVNIKGNYRACVDIKGTGKFYIHVHGNTTGYPYGIATAKEKSVPMKYYGYDIDNGSSYTKYCSPYLQHTGQSASSVAGSYDQLLAGVDIQSRSSKPTWLYLSSFYMEKEASTPEVPTPVK